MENFGNLMLRRVKAVKEPGLPDLSCKTTEKRIYIEKVWEEQKSVRLGIPTMRDRAMQALTTAWRWSQWRKQLRTGSRLDFGNTEALKMHVSMRFVYSAERILHSGFWKGI